MPSCYKCNAPIAEGNTFCGQCGAPQIRVSAPESAPNETHPPVLPVQHHVAPPPAAIIWANALQKAAIAGLAMTLAINLFSLFLPALLVIVLGLPAGGAFAVWLYHRGTRQSLTGGMGARIGAVSGIFGFLITLLIGAAEMKGRRAEFMAALKQAMEEQLKRNPDPQAQEVAQKLMSPEGVAIIMTVAVVFGLFFYLVLCSIGGAMGASLTREERS